MIPTAQPIQTYEIYPGCDPPRFIREFLEGKRITIDAFCKNERITPYDFERMANEVMTEWELTEATHRDRKDAIMHLINHIRIKHRNEQRNNQSREIRAFARPNQDADERMADIAQELLRQSSGRNQP
ncbi:MAG: hypothetical protein K2H46_02620 [Muribaculaceae bacterium]|nr:hypothetical protein [Muribaculaceae bacterium]